MNTKIIKLDLNRRLYDKIIAKQGDTKSRFLLFQLLDGSIAFNLTNRSVRAYMLKPDGKEIFNDLIINNYSLGYCTLELTNQVLAVPGTVKIELMVTEEDRKLTSSVFELEVIKSINSEKSIVSTNEFTALLNGLSSLSEYDNYKNEIAAARDGEVNLLTKVKKIDEQLEEIATIIDFVKLENETWDEAINRIIAKGNTVKFLNKTYELFNPIILKSNTKILMHDDTILTRNHDSYVFLSEFTKDTIKYEGAKNILIENGTIVHNGSLVTKNLCLLFHADNVTFNNVTFKDTVNTHSIDIVGSQNIYINKCKFLGYISTDTEKFRESIQIDYAGVSGAGLDLTLYPTSSKCYDGMRSRNIFIEKCIFDESENNPAPHNAIGTHSQGENPKYGDLRSNNIHIRDNKFKGNGLFVTEKDDGGLTRAGKAIRLLQMQDVFIENNTFENYGRTISLEIFKYFRSLIGDKISDESVVKKQILGNININIKNNTIISPDVESTYAWNCIAIDSQFTDVNHNDIKITENTIINLGVNNNRSIGIRNVNRCYSVGNNITGGAKGHYIEMETSTDITTRDNKYNNVSIPVDFVGAYLSGAGESLELWEDGTNRKYLIYIPNSVENISEKPSIRVKSVESGNFSDLVIKQKPEWINATYNEGVSDYSSSVKCKFAKDDFGFVHLEGACTHQVNQSNLTLFTLPEGYRPTMNLAFVTVASGSSGKATNRIKVNTNGTVVLESTDSESSTPYTNLNGVIFST